MVLGITRKLENECPSGNVYARNSNCFMEASKNKDSSKRHKTSDNSNVQEGGIITETKGNQAKKNQRPSVFKVVKQNITARQVAEFYGINVKHNGMACCPFHDDKTPSMKLDKRYYCFGCHATGDAVDFVSNLFQIGKLEAAKQIAEDFHLDYDRSTKHSRDKPATAEQKREMEMRQLIKDFRRWRSKTLSDLSGDYRLLTEKAERYQPTDREAPFPSRFIEAVSDRERVEFYIGLLEQAPREAQLEFYVNERAAIERLHRKVAIPAEMRDSVRIKLKDKLKLLQPQQGKCEPKVVSHNKAAAL